MSDLDWDILEGLEAVLSVRLFLYPRFLDVRSSKQQVPHTFQQSMSSESTPVLSRAISSFEMFMTDWEILGAEHSILKFWTDIGLDWAKKYYIRMDETDAYVVTMCKFYIVMSPLGLPT